MTRCDCETSTIDTIEPHIEERKTCLVEDLMDRRERVVLKVLVWRGASIAPPAVGAWRSIHCPFDLT